MDCGYVHIYKYCFNYQNTTCCNKNCPYLHCTSVEQFQYEATRNFTENLKKEVGRTLQSKNICHDYKISSCNRDKCERRHIKFDDIKPLKCSICITNITINNFGATECGHVFCYKCALQLLDDYAVNVEIIKVKCPICRFTADYIIYNYLYYVL